MTAAEKRIDMKLSVKFTKPRRRALFAAAVLAAVIIIITAVLNKSNAEKPRFFNTNAEYVEGIDVSQHNGEIDWDKAAKATDFAIIRAGYRSYGGGDITEDSRFRENAARANGAKIPIGVYFYTQAITPEEAEDEADFVIDLIQPYNIDLPVFIDFEYPYDSDGNATGRMNSAALSGSEIADIINAFCARIKRAGFSAGLYSSSSLLNFNIKTAALDNDLFLWVADYNAKVTYLGEYDMWQYSKRGSCDGVNSKYTDMNRWYAG